MTEVSINKQARLSQHFTLIERNANGNYWVHFAVRPKDNRRRISILSAAR